MSKTRRVKPVKFVVGMGNYAKNDDGIGLRVVETIVDDGLDDGFEALEAGNDPTRLLACLQEGVDRVLIVDCAVMGLSPGDYQVFSLKDVASKKEIGRGSTHDGDVVKFIELASDMGHTAPRVDFFAIEPKSLEMEMALSATLEEKLPEYVQAVIEEIKR
jgi:hydrogenase maturation protease